MHVDLRRLLRRAPVSSGEEGVRSKKLQSIWAARWNRGWRVFRMLSSGSGAYRVGVWRRTAAWASFFTGLCGILPQFPVIIIKKQGMLSYTNRMVTEIPGATDYNGVQPHCALKCRSLTPEPIAWSVNHDLSM